VTVASGFLQNTDSFSLLRNGRALTIAVFSVVCFDNNIGGIFIRSSNVLLMYLCTSLYSLYYSCILAQLFCPYTTPVSLYYTRTTVLSLYYTCTTVPPYYTFTNSTALLFVYHRATPIYLYNCITPGLLLYICTTVLFLYIVHLYFSYTPVFL